MRHYPALFQKYIKGGISLLAALFMVHLACAQNVGIGTANPQARLHINGDLLLQQGFAVSKFSRDSLMAENSHSNVPTERAVRQYMQRGLWTGIDTAAISTNALVAKGYSIMGLQSPNAVALQGNYAFVTSWSINRLSAFNISDLSNPAPLQTISTNLDRPGSVFVLGNYAYVTSEGNNRLCVFNISNPNNLTAAGFVGTNKAPNSVFVQSNFAYVTSNEGNDLGIYDVSNPAVPVFRGSITTNMSLPNWVVVQGNFAYVASRANNRLCIYDVSNPNAPAARGFTSAGLNDPTQVYVKGNYAYVTSRNNNRVQVFNVSDPNNITVAGFTQENVYGPYAIHGAGNYIFVANNFNLISVYDISNPATPVAKGYNSANLSAPGSIFALGDVLAVPSYYNNRLCLFTLDRSYNLAVSPTGIQSVATDWQRQGINIYKDEGNVGIGTSQPNARLHVEGNTYLIGDLAVGTTNQYASQTFANALGSKIALYATDGSSQYGLGVQSGLLQLYSDGGWSNIGFGWGSSTSFTERARIINSGADGMQLNGRLVLRNGTADVANSTGIWLTKPDNSSLQGFVGVQNADNMGFYGGPSNNGWGLTYNTNTSNVGIGTSNATRRLDVVGGPSASPATLLIGNRGGFGPAALEFVSDYGLASQWRPGYIQSNDNGGFTGRLEFFTNGTGSGNLYGAVKGFEVRNGTALTATGTVGSYSDERLKQNVVPFTDGLNVIEQISPVQFQYKPDAPFATREKQVGIIAQELEKAAPYMVHQTTENGVNDLRWVDNQAYIFLLINAVKEQQQLIKALQQKIEELSKK
jgi:hypothetical protein